MTFFDFTFHWISGMMVGVELLAGDDYIEGEHPVKWGIVFDLVILRIIILVRDLD